MESVIYLIILVFIIKRRFIMIIYVGLLYKL
jgi:hypothetical protein